MSHRERDFYNNVSVIDPTNVFLWIKLVKK